MSILHPNKDKENDIHAIAPIPERLKKNKRVAMITGDKVEDVEFFYPYYRLTEAGYQVDVFTEKGGSFEGKHGMGLKDSMDINHARPNDYELLYLPGGKAPSKLMKSDAVLNFVSEFARTGKPIAALCHGPQILAAAGLLKGRRVAAWPELEDEMKDAGATFVNEALVEDGQFITGRMPGDLHRHLYGVMDYLEGMPGGRAGVHRYNAA